MGTISDKLTYLNDTKGLLKQKINNLGGDITDQTTFREYVDKLQTIYDNAPKTSYAEGSSITLSNCLKGKLDFEDGKVGYGDTSQESTTGKNLLKIKTLTETTVNGITFTPVYANGLLQYVNVNGTATNTATFSLQEGNADFPSTYVETLTAGTYTLDDSTNSGNQLVSIFLRYTTDGINFTGLSSQSAQKTFTINEQIKYTSFIRIQGGQTVSNVKFKPQIEKNSSATTYEPYTNGPAPNPSYPFPINTVTGTQTVNIKDGSNNIIATKTLNLGNIELAEIGTYRDYIWTDRETGKWYKHSAIDKFLINSNLQISFSTSTVGYDLVRIDDVTAPNVERPIMSSAFIGIIPEYGVGNVPTNRNANNIYVNYVIQKIDICTVKNAFSSANDFLTQLDGTPIYYAKTTATDTEITDTNLINQLEDIYNSMSINGTTVIEINGDLPMIIKCRALKGE